MPALRWRPAARVEAAGADAEIPGYRVLEPVGRGGFSVVYKAHQEALDRVVALKVLTVEPADDRVRQRFLREVRLTTRLSGHPHVVTVLDAGMTTSARPYIAMDYFESGSLHDRLEAQGSLPAADVTAIGAKIGGALSAAHQLGILHRDVKPQNILVSRFGEPALADFGVALLVSSPGSTGRTEALTPCHAAPEILQGAEPSAAADVYSLGSTLYELLAGWPAYQQDGQGIAQLITRIVNEPPPPLTRPDIPEPLRAAVLRAMSRDPAERFGTAAAFVAALGSAPAAATRQEVARRKTVRQETPTRSAEPGPAETMLRPGRGRPAPARPAGPRARRGWWQLALAACVIATLAAGGVYLGVKRSAAAQRGAIPVAGHHRATVTGSRLAPATTAPSPRPSPSRAPTAAPPRSAPSAPQALTVTATANHSIALGWSGPASDGGAPVSYDVSWTGAASGSVSGLIGTSFTVTGLVNSATYSLSVTAVNSAGTSQPATVSQALTPPPEPFNTFRNSQLPLLIKAQPNLQSDTVATIPVLTGSLGPQVIVACQVIGSDVTDPVNSALTGDVWDKVSYNGVTGYTSDLYVDTPQSQAGNFGAFSDPPLWQCT